MNRIKSCSYKIFLCTEST